MSYTYEFLKLQNGSDIRGVAVAGVPCLLYTSDAAENREV